MPETKNMSLDSLHTLHTHNSITRPAARGHALNAHNAHNPRLLNHLDKYCSTVKLYKTQKMAANQVNFMKLI